MFRLRAVLCGDWPILDDDDAGDGDVDDAVDDDGDNDNMEDLKTAGCREGGGEGFTKGVGKHNLSFLGRNQLILSFFKLPPPPYSPPSFTTLSIRAEFLGRSKAAGRDCLNQSRPHKRNFLKL